MVVDFSNPVELYRRNDVFPVAIERIDLNGDAWIKTPKGVYSYDQLCYSPNSGTDYNGWRIRNVTPQPSPDLQARCVALVERMADGMDAHADGPSRFCMQDYKEARAIMDEMRPVDPDLIEARKCAAQAQLTSVAEVTRRGGMDDQPIVIAARAAIRRGRALERGE